MASTISHAQLNAQLAQGARRDAFARRGLEHLDAVFVGLAINRARFDSCKIDWPEGFCRKDIGWRAIA